MEQKQQYTVRLVSLPDKCKHKTEFMLSAVVGIILVQSPSDTLPNHKMPNGKKTMDKMPNGKMTMDKMPNGKTTMDKIPNITTRSRHQFLWTF